MTLRIRKPRVLQKRLFASALNKVASRVHDNSVELKNKKYDSVPGMVLYKELQSQIKHDRIILGKEQEKRKKGLKGVIRATLSPKAYAKVLRARKKRVSPEQYQQARNQMDEIEILLMLSKRKLSSGAEEKKLRELLPHISKWTKIVLQYEQTHGNEKTPVKHTMKL